MTFTFDEFVQYGVDCCSNIVNGMPWSFTFKGHAVSHENDECYLINTLTSTLRFTPQDVLKYEDGVISINRAR